MYDSDAKLAGQRASNRTGHHLRACVYKALYYMMYVPSTSLFLGCTLPVPPRRAAPCSGLDSRGWRPKAAVKARYPPNSVPWRFGRATVSTLATDDCCGHLNRGPAMALAAAPPPCGGEGWTPQSPGAIAAPPSCVAAIRTEPRHAAPCSGKPRRAAASSAVPRHAAPFHGTPRHCAASRGTLHRAAASRAAVSRIPAISLILTLLLARAKCTSNSPAATGASLTYSHPKCIFSRTLVLKVSSNS